MDSTMGFLTTALMTAEETYVHKNGMSYNVFAHTRQLNETNIMSYEGQAALAASICVN